MNFSINRYGEIEVLQNKIQYTIPIAYTGTTELDEIENAYREKGKELLNNPLYLFAENLQIVRDRFSFTFHLEEKKAFHYIRKLRFEEQIYYFLSLIELAKNEETTILWDKNNLLIDPEEQKIKTFIFSFKVHPIHSSVTAIDGLKEMILLSLTTLHRVLGKPQRTDFIDQRENVIRFAELILQAKNIIEIEQIVNAAIFEVERDLEIERERQEKLKNMSLLSRLKEKKKARKEIASSRENCLYNTKKYNHLQGEKKKTFWDSKYFYVGAAAIALIFLVANAIGIFDIPSKPAAAEPKEESKNKQTEEIKQITSSELADIYRKAIIGKEAEALNILEDYGYENLSKQDKAVMLKLYEKTGQYKELIELSPELTEEIVNRLISENDLETLKTLKSIEHPLIAFEVAYIENEWDKVIQLKDTVELTEKRQLQILTAYLQLDKLDDAKEFAQGNPELEKLIQNFQSEQELEQESQLHKEEKKK